MTEKDLENIKSLRKKVQAMRPVDQALPHENPTHSKKGVINALLFLENKIKAFVDFKKKGGVRTIENLSKREIERILSGKESLIDLSKELGIRYPSLEQYHRRLKNKIQTEKQ